MSEKEGSEIIQVDEERELFTKMKSLVEKEVEELPQSGNRRWFLRSVIAAAAMPVVAIPKVSKAWNDECSAFECVPACEVTCQAPGGLTCTWGCLVTCETSCEWSCQGECLVSCETQCQAPGAGCQMCQDGGCQMCQSGCLTDWELCQPFQTPWCQGGCETPELLNPSCTVQCEVIGIMATP